MLFLFSCVLLLCGSVGPSRDGSRQRVGIFFFFLTKSAHTSCTRLPEPGRARPSGASTSSSPDSSVRFWSPRRARLSRRRALCSSLGRRGGRGRGRLQEEMQHSRSWGDSPPPPQLSSREREQGSKTQSGRRAREERFWSFEKSFPQIRKRKESERELAKRGGRRGRPPGKVGDRKAEAMKPGPPGTGSTGLDHRTELGNSGSRTVQERNRAQSREPCGD